MVVLVVLDIEAEAGAVVAAEILHQGLGEIPLTAEA